MGWRNFASATISAGSSSAWATSRQPRLASNFLHLEPLHEYTQFSVQEIRRQTPPRARRQLANLGAQSRLCLGRQLDLDIVAASDTESKSQEMDVLRRGDGTLFLVDLKS